MAFVDRSNRRRARTIPKHVRKNLQSALQTGHLLPMAVFAPSTLHLARDSCTVTTSSDHPPHLSGISRANPAAAATTNLDFTNLHLPPTSTITTTIMDPPAGSPSPPQTDAPSLPPQMFTTSAQLLDLTDSTHPPRTLHPSPSLTQLRKAPNRASRWSKAHWSAASVGPGAFHNCCLDSPADTVAVWLAQLPPRYTETAVDRYEQQTLCCRAP